MTNPGDVGRAPGADSQEEQGTRLPQPAVSGFSRYLRAILPFLILGASISLLAVWTSRNGSAAQKDFISYWAAGRLLLQHQNPYDPALVFQLEKAAGFAEPEPLVMRNPPYALFLALPLGFLNPPAGLVLWTLMIVGCIVASVQVLRRIYGGQLPRGHFHAYLFAPSLACMTLGQTSPVILLGVAGFLKWYRQRPFSAGLCLVLIAIKPHLLLPFGVVLVCWALLTGSYRILSGAIGGLALTMAIPLWLDRTLCSDFLPVLRKASSDSKVIPTVSSMLLLAAGRQRQWIQLLPALCAGIWAFGLYWRHRREWDWSRYLPLLLVISIWVAPYSWLSDEIVVLPAILAANEVRTSHGKSITLFVALNGLAMVLVLLRVPMSSGAFLWTTSAWAGWYLLSLCK